MALSGLCGWPSLRVAARDEDGGTSCARRRRERHQRSWWRHEQLHVAAALRHGPSPQRWPCGGNAARGVELETHVGQRAQVILFLGARPAPLSEVAWPGRRRQSRSVTWLLALPPSSWAHDEAAAVTVRFLLSFLARAAEEEKAREEAEVKLLEDEVVDKEPVAGGAGEGPGQQSRSLASRRLPCSGAWPWKRPGRKRGGGRSAAPHDASSFLSSFSTSPVHVAVLFAVMVLPEM